MSEQTKAAKHGDAFDYLDQSPDADIARLRDWVDTIDAEPLSRMTEDGTMATWFSAETRERNSSFGVRLSTARHLLATLDRVKEMEADAARLDWLDRDKGQHVEPTPHDNGGRPWGFFPEGSDPEFGGIGYAYTDLRAAVDAALDTARAETTTESYIPPSTDETRGDMRCGFCDGPMPCFCSAPASKAVTP